MDFKLNNFSGKAPVFPLPETVFFPKTFLPLNIFEDRYKKMLVDSLKNEKIICISLLKPGFENNYEKNPKINLIGCLGRIEIKNDTPTGTYNILLSGLKKVKINEIKSKKEYRVAELEVINEIYGDENLDLLKEKVFRAFERMSIDNDYPKIPDEFKELIDFEMAVNFLVSYLPIDIIQKQKLLELDDISLRAKILVQFMDSSLGKFETGDINTLGDLRFN